MLQKLLEEIINESCFDSQTCFSLEDETVWDAIEAYPIEMNDNDLKEDFESIEEAKDFLKYEIQSSCDKYTESGRYL